MARSLPFGVAGGPDHAATKGALLEQLPRLR
jgi:hypothetical protein